MKKIFAGSLAAALVAGGLGLSTGPAQASPISTTTTRISADALPLDLCDLLPLCDAPVVGPLLEGVEEALADLLGTVSTGNPTEIQGSVEDLVDAIVAALDGAGADQESAANAIAAQLGALDPALLTQILGDLAGQSPVLGELITGILQTVQDLVEGLLGLGGQTPDPAQIQGLVEQLLAALAGGNPSDLQALLTELLTSLPGGSTLSPSTLTDLIDQLIKALQGTLGVGTAVNNVDNAIKAGTPVAVSATPTVSAPRGYFTNTHPTLRGNGTPGAFVTVRTTTGSVLGSATVTPAGTYALTSRKLKIAAYQVTATQVEQGRATSAQSASRSFRVVSAKPVIKTKSKKKFSTKRPTITGIAYPKTRIVLRSSTGKALGSAKVRADGTWKIKSKKLSSGTRKVKVVQTGYGKKKTSKVRTIRIK